MGSWEATSHTYTKGYHEYQNTMYRSNNQKGSGEKVTLRPKHYTSLKWNIVGLGENSKYKLYTVKPQRVTIIKLPNPTISSEAGLLVILLVLVDDWR